jgi:Ca2+-binding EF-hand superfamily protein/voltage-gated potassium channel Kch
LGLSATTGAFAAGVLLAGNRYRAQIKADVRPFEGILLGIFFMTAGASLNPIIVLNNIPVLATGIVAFITVKALVLFLGGASLGKSWGSAARVAITLSGGGEFSLVLFKVAQDLGVLQKDLADLLIASVIISMSLTPFLGDLADAYGSYLESREGVKSEGGLMTKAEAEALFESIDTDQSGSIELEELQEALIPYRLNYITIAEIFAAFDVNGDGTISGEEWTAGVEAGLLASALVMGEAAAGAGAALQPQQAIASDAICICGYTEFGKEMMSVLRAVGATKNGGVVAFELNPKRVAAAVSLGVNVVYGDGASPSLLRAAGVTNPRAVIVAFRSESRRLEATSRLREALPAGTPIYAREVSGQLLGRDELIQAGATECVSERREAALRFADLVGVVNTDQAALLRGDLGLEVFDVAPAPETIPGIPEDRFEDLVTEFGCTKRELERLYKIFSSVPGMNGERFIDISELRDVFLRTAGDGPIDDEELERWTEMANSDGGGKLSFVDFARVYFSTRMAR